MFDTYLFSVFVVSCVLCKIIVISPSLFDSASASCVNPADVSNRLWAQYRSLVQEVDTKAEVVHLTPGLLGSGLLFNCHQ